MPPFGMPPQQEENIPLHGMFYSDIRKAEDRLAAVEADIDRYRKLKISAYEDMRDGILSKEDYLDIKEQYEMRISEAQLAEEQIRHEINLYIENGNAPQRWIQEFLDHRNIQSLTRIVAVECIDHIMIYEGKRIEVTFAHMQAYEALVSAIIFGIFLEGLIHLLPRIIRQVLYFSGLLCASGMMERTNLVLTDLVLTDLLVYNAVLAEIRVAAAFDDLSVWKLQAVYGPCVVGFQLLGHVSKFLVFFRRFGTVWRHNFFYCAHQLAREIRCPSHKRAQSQFRHNVLSQIVFSGLQQFDRLSDRSIFVRIFFHSRHVHGHQCFEMHNDVPF